MSDGECLMYLQLSQLEEYNSAALLTARLSAAVECVTCKMYTPNVLKRCLCTQIKLLSNIY